VNDVLLELAGLALLFLLVVGIAAWKASRNRHDDDGEDSGDDSSS
jgi:uncharacterized iron-regulated membrane protein